ncbi:hypothetical protein CTEN210_10691 [Chaetoceros tenuissimus]|uniref:Uncharacterized protein n=1 Tax=Chaetoceros tenuissimus TaxID=426638 RepID=A0AAD3H8E3_9STRA|nr:hypothetical protein CTEN210_10691 [Chaetoceros tenuissimus]
MSNEEVQRRGGLFSCCFQKKGNKVSPQHEVPHRNKEDATEDAKVKAFLEKKRVEEEATKEVRNQITTEKENTKHEIVEITNEDLTVELQAFEAIKSILSTETHITIDVESKLETARDKDPKFFELTQGYIHNDQWVDMSKPRRCNFKDDSGENDDDSDASSDIKQIGKFRNRKEDGAHDLKEQYRAITLRQLRAVFHLVSRMCEENEIPVSKLYRKKAKKTTTTLVDNHSLLGEVTLFDILDLVVKPFTQATGKSLVECLPSTTGSQPPRWFVNNYNGEPFLHTMVCIEQMYKDFALSTNNNDANVFGLSGGGMTEDTPIWIRAFAHRQCDETESIDLKRSGFARAMKCAGHRTLTILDQECKGFKDARYLLELSMSQLKDKERAENQEVSSVWAVYTARDHIFEDPDYGDEELRHAVGIVSSGMAPADLNYRSTTHAASSNREKHFPQIRCLAALSIDVTKAIVDNVDTTSDVLDFVKKLEAPEKVNEVCRGAFVSTVSSLKAALNRNNATWEAALVALNRGLTGRSQRLMFDFGKDQGWDKLTQAKATALMRHLPPSVQVLSVSHFSYGESMMNALIDWVENAKYLRSLTIKDTCVGGAEGGKLCGIRLAKAIGASKTIERLELSATDLVGSRNSEAWEKALQESNENSLSYVELNGMKYLENMVDKSSFDPKTSTIRVTSLDGQHHRLAWVNNQFSDATLSVEEEESLEDASCASVEIDDMN